MSTRPRVHTLIHVSLCNVPLYDVGKVSYTNLNAFISPMLVPVYHHPPLIMYRGGDLVMYMDILDVLKMHATGGTSDNCILPHCTILDTSRIFILHCLKKNRGWGDLNVCGPKREIVSFRS